MEMEIGVDLGKVTIWQPDGCEGLSSLTPAEARDLAGQLLAAAEKLEPRKPVPAAPVVSWCEGMV